MIFYIVYVKANQKILVLLRSSIGMKALREGAIYEFLELGGDVKRARKKSNRLIN